MSDANDNDGRGGRAPLTLKPRPGGSISSGTVKQSFSHGRSKTVVVETKRRRIDAPAPQVEKRPTGFDVKRQPATEPRPLPPASTDTSKLNLSAEEAARRQRAVEAAREHQEVQAAQRRDEDARKAEEAARRQAESASAAADSASSSGFTWPSGVEISALGISSSTGRIRA